MDTEVRTAVSAALATGVAAMARFEAPWPAVIDGRVAVCDRMARLSFENIVVDNYDIGFIPTVTLHPL